MRQEELLARLRSGTPLGDRDAELALFAELAQAMRDASICGLGQAAPNPVLSVLKYFPQEVE